MKKERKDESFIKKPFYKGGNKAMTDFIYNELKYPKEAAENKIEGVVYCKYDIDFMGNVVDVRILKGLGFGCDEEAARVIKLLKFVIPKIPRNLKILFHKDIQIYFKPATVPALNQVPQQGYKITYNLIEEKKNNEEIPQKKNTFSYTIKFN